MDQAPQTQTLPLRKPIITHGTGATSTSTLTLNMPKGSLVLRLGEPFVREATAGGGVRYGLDPDKARQYLVDMTGLDDGVLGQLHALDIIAAYDKLAMMLRPTDG
jgi:hypothetical protein